MKALNLGAAVAAALAAGACTTYADEPATPEVASLRADVRDARGASKGQVTAMQVGSGIRVQISAMNMPQGVYAAHVHTTGRCDAPGFTSAGGHWNPTGREHGKDNPDGMHKGDLPNLLVGTDGRGTMEYTIMDAQMLGGAGSMMDADGAAVVFHAKADDYRSDPAGNAGDRIACGVLG